MCQRPHFGGRCGGNLRSSKHTRMCACHRFERFAVRRIRQGTARGRHGYPGAAVLGARMRFRAVMMTSFAFILGVYPLVVAQGAAEISRHGVGPVFAGIIAASAIGLFVIPMLYVTFQTIRERS